MDLDLLLTTFEFAILSIARGFLALFPFMIIHFVYSLLKKSDLMPFPPFRKMCKYSLIAAGISFINTALYTYGQIDTDTAVSVALFGQILYPFLLFVFLQSNYKLAQNIH